MFNPIPIQLLHLQRQQQHPPQVRGYGFWPNTNHHTVQPLVATTRSPPRVPPRFERMTHLLLNHPLNGVMGCPRFEFKQLLGRGSYGTVSKVYDRVLKKEVAVKEVSCDFRSQDPNDMVHYKSAIREISILRSLGKSPNIVEFYEIVSVPLTRTTLILLECMETDLRKYLEQHHWGRPMDLVYVQALCHQLVYGTLCMHSKGIIHRDLKPSNLLLNPNTGVLKITDFGLARTYDMPDRGLSFAVVSLWYRSPELLLNVEKYGPEIDIWSVGCIIAEMITGCTAFPGPSYDDKHQLGLIFHLMGSPNESTWPGITGLLLKSGIDYTAYSPGYILERFPVLLNDFQSYRLLMSMLVCNPKKRISADEAFAHPFFSNRSRASLSRSGGLAAGGISQASERRS